MNPTQKNNFMPDTIPFKVAELPNGEAGTVQATEVDNEARVAMNLNEDPEVEKGDFWYSIRVNSQTLPRNPRFTMVL